MKKIKMIALDLDGTTLADGGILTENTKKVLEEACRRGVHIVVASGRSFYSLPECIHQVEGLEYSINSNGSSVYRLHTAERICHETLNSACVPTILAILQEENACIECFVDGIAYADQAFVEDPVGFGATEQGRIYIQKTRKPVDGIVSFIQDNITNLDAIDAVVSNPEQKARLEEKLAQAGDFYLTSSVDHLIEMAGSRAGKAAALQWLAGELRIAPEEVMACGNAENDRDMLLYAGYGVAVANSPESLKRDADYVTEDNNHEGVANAIRRLVLDSGEPQNGEEPNAEE